jgi:small ligand-binding sensory domain FIST
MPERFAAALSEHPIPAHAAGEVIGAVVEAVGEAPDLAVLFATAPHTGAVEDMAGAVREVIRPGTLIGTTAVSILAGSREVEDRPAVALWAARIGRVQPLRLAAVMAPDGYAIRGLDDAALTTGRSLLLLPDPFSFPVDPLLEHLRTNHPDVAVVGGLASAARGPGGNRLVLDSQIHDDGAVGVMLDAGQAVTTVVSQGCRPVGDPFVVTRAEGQMIYELGGRPALERLEELVGALSPSDRELIRSGVHMGRVIDERKEAFSRGDFLVRNVLGADREVGAIAVGDVVEVGCTVQFQVRDAVSADEDLRLLLADQRAPGALVFTCNGRGTNLFGRPDHDAGVVSEATGAATAGMFCAGELGPIGGQSFLHGFTASVVLFP